MSRSRHRTKPGGFDYWSRRPHSGFGYGPAVKRVTHHAERQQGKEDTTAGLDELADERQAEPGGPGE